jgi:nitrogen fixation NifU-like protein
MGLSEIYTEIIMEHNQSKHNKGELEHADHSIRGHNPNCGDDITLHLIIEDGFISDMKYNGVGCAISEASTSIMIDLLKGESVELAKEKVKLFIGMIKDEVPDEVAEEELLDASILSNIKTMPARVKCAVLAWHALEQGIIEAEAPK